MTKVKDALSGLRELGHISYKGEFDQMNKYIVVQIHDLFKDFTPLSTLEFNLFYKLESVETYVALRILKMYLVIKKYATCESMPKNIYKSVKITQNTFCDILDINNRETVGNYISILEKEGIVTVNRKAIPQSNGSVYRTSNFYQIKTFDELGKLGKK
jgi:hypothetical protein